MILILLLMEFAGLGVSLPVAIIITVLWNILMWGIGPVIADIIYRWLYHIEWVDLDHLARISPESANIIRKVCQEYSIAVPRLGIIPDNNPNAFTYGSGKWNSRIVVTKGIFTFLNEAERAAVYGHEL